MKLRKREFDIFSLSFLDIISCGFGAVIMLVLISKPNDDVSITGIEEIENLLKTVITLENTISEIKQTIESQFSKVDQLSIKKEQLEADSIRLESKIQKQTVKQASLADDLQGLALVQSTLKQASISTPKKINTTRDEEVGGIPVDSDYVIFIVDTSGSMRQIWNRVSSEIINVLNIA